MTDPIAGTSCSEDNGHAPLRLTPMQAKFVDLFVGNGGNATEAARLSGYAVPRDAGYRLKNSPKISAAISRLVRRQLSTDGARKATGVVLHALAKDSFPMSLRVKAATWVLEQTVFAGSGESNDWAQQSSGDTMSTEELENFIEQARAVLQRPDQISSQE